VKVRAEEARRRQAHSVEQTQLDEAWTRLKANDPQTVAMVLTHALVDLQLPALPVGVAEDQASIVVTALPARELVPEGRAEIERNGLYFGVIASNVVAVARWAFAVAPGLQTVSVVVIRRDDGARSFTPIFATEVSRPQLERTDWDRESSALEVVAGARASRIALRGGAHELAELNLSDEPELAQSLARVAKQLRLHLDPATKAT
jgi:hypothetical protein